MQGQDMQARSAGVGRSGSARLAAVLALITCLVGVSIVPVRAHAATVHQFHKQTHKHQRGPAVAAVTAASTEQPPLRQDVHAIGGAGSTAHAVALAGPASSAASDDADGRAPLTPRTRGPPTATS